MYETCTSTTADTIKITKAILDVTVCFTIPIFIFSFLLSFIIDLYSFILLTPKISIAGINNKFCSNKEVNMNDIPLPNPIVAIVAEIVYPRQNPLNNIIPKTIGIPITVVPANHNKHAKITSSFIFNFKLSVVSTFPCLLFSI